MSIPTLRSLDLTTKKRRVPREARLRLPWSVWADAHDLEVEFEFKKPVSVATPPFPVTFIFQK